MDESREWGDPAALSALSGFANAARAQWRAEQEAAIGDAAEAFFHARCLLDLLNGYMRNGDRVALSVGPHKSSGDLVEVARGYVAMRLVGSTRVDFQLLAEMPYQLSVQQRNASQARGHEMTRGSFRARLLELESLGTEVTLGTMLSSEQLVGRLRVGADHVLLARRGGGETVLGLHTVVFVSPRES